MEDAATAEICRAQVWQWVKHGAKLENGTIITKGLVTTLVAEQKQKLPPSERLSLAARAIKELMTREEFPDFLTLACYELLD
jgi:malate synthase